MKKILLLLALTASIFAAKGQSLEAMKNNLQQPDPRMQSRVVVVEHDDAAAAVRSLRASSPGEKIRGFRVCIYTDNRQEARAQANGIRTRFNELYPEIPTYISYNAPDWKVTAGNCLTREEAVMLVGKIAGVFDRAFVSQEEIPLSLFGESEVSIPEGAVEESAE